VKVDLYTFVGMFSRAVGTAVHILDKGVAFAQANGVSEAEMLEWRLAEDMFPLRRQLHIVIDFPKTWMARAIGQEPPAQIEGETTVAQLRDALAGTQAWLAALKPEQFAGRDDVPQTVNLGQIEPTFSTAQWVTGFATTNLLFHLSIAYAILRHKGVQLGKADLFAGGL
jgi:uncharacterized protein